MPGLGWVGLVRVVRNTLRGKHGDRYLDNYVSRLCHLGCLDQFWVCFSAWWDCALYRRASPSYLSATTGRHAAYWWATSSCSSRLSHTRLIRLRRWEYCFSFCIGWIKDYYFPSPLCHVPLKFLLLGGERHFAGKMSFKRKRTRNSFSFISHYSLFGELEIMQGRWVKFTVPLKTLVIEITR